MAEILAGVAAEVGGLVDPSRLRRAKTAYTTRRVVVPPAAALVRGASTAPRAGDVVLARVTAVGQHKRLELPDGRRAHLFPGDEILVAYGNRYAPDQYEAEIPGDLAPCDLVAAGGVAARALCRHAAIGEPTQLEPLGLLADADGRRLNLADCALAQPEHSRPDVPTVAVVGTAMNAGKTTTAAGLIRGLTASGLRVGAAKVTGTGAGGDVWLFRDSGADPVLDFTDAGMVSTYLAPIEAIEDAFTLLHRRLAGAGVDAIVLEVADGILQRETAELVVRRRFRELVDGVLFAAGDATGAIAGVAWLRERGLPLLGVSGLFSASPLAMREAEAIGAPIHDLASLGAGELAAALRARTVARAA